jgi:hypothetical protein
MTSNARFTAIAILIMLATIWILVSYARAIRCSWCHGRWAIYSRPTDRKRYGLDLCRSCAKTFDAEQRRRRPRSVLRRVG